MLFVDNEVNFFIMDGFLKVENDFFREFVDDIRGNVGEEVFNCSVGCVRWALIEVREELVDIFCGFLSLVSDVRVFFVLDCGDQRGFGSLIMGGKMIRGVFVPVVGEE